MSYLAAAKTYRASANIASGNKSCPACQQRIRIGMPVVFLAPTTDLAARPVAHHAGCVQHRLITK